MSFDGFITKILDALFEKKKNTDEEFCLFCRTASPQEIQIMFAAYKINYESIIEAFIKGGADLNLRDIHGKRALEHAIEGNNKAAIKVLQEFQTKPKPTKPAPVTVIKSEPPDIDLRKLFMDYMIDEAIKNGADPNQTHNGQPVLSYFVLEHRSAPVISLLKAGAKPNLIYTDLKGRRRTPFPNSLLMVRKYVDIKELKAEGDACLEVVAACIVYGGSLKLIKEKCPDVLEAVCTANDKYSLSWNETVMLKLNEILNSGVLR